MITIVIGIVERQTLFERFAKTNNIWLFCRLDGHFETLFNARLQLRSLRCSILTLSLSLFLSQPDRSALVWRESIDRNEVRGNLDIKGRDIEMESFIRFVRAETPDRWNFRIVLFVSNHSVSTVFDKFFTPPSLSLFLFFLLFSSLSLFPLLSISRRSNNTNEIVNRFGGRRLNPNRTSLAISRPRAVIRRIRFQAIHDRQCFEKPTFDFSRRFLFSLFLFLSFSLSLSLSLSLCLSVSVARKPCVSNQIPTSASGECSVPMFLSIPEGCRIYIFIVLTSLDVLMRFFKLQGLPALWFPIDSP